MKITLETAKNGIIKTIEDSNANGAGDAIELKVLYDTEQDEGSFSVTQRFLKEVIKDVGLNTGNVNSDKTLFFGVKWGENFIPTKNDIEKRIKSIQDELEYLHELKNDSH